MFPVIFCFVGLMKACLFHALFVVLFSLHIFQQDVVISGGCSSAGRVGQLVIGRSLVQIPALGWAELHVKVFLSKILNPTLLISEGLETAEVGYSSNTSQPHGKG